MQFRHTNRINRINRMHVPTWITVLACVLLAWHGPIAQPAHYHDFADQQMCYGIAHFADVVSNVGFALVALWGWWQLRPAAGRQSLRYGWAGYRLFLMGLFLTALGSAYYHLAPDNQRLVWDRLPIALLCAGLLAGVWGDVWKKSSRLMALGLGVAAVCSVGWWHVTEQAGAGDLRPYLLLQGLPLVLIPVWQWAHGAPRADRLAFAGAVLLYVLAKFAELADHQIAAITGGLTGHTAKHLLATVAAALIVARLVRRSACVTNAGCKALPCVS